MNNKIIAFTAMALLCLKLTAQENDVCTNHRADSHAPISIMGDHVHKKGGFMFSYRYMYMNMNGIQQADNDISDMMFYSKYMVKPQSMNMQMHMLGLMYGITDKVTLMAMLSYKQNSMDLSMMMNNMSFTTQSNGIGDAKIGGLINLINKVNQHIHANIGVNLPIGSTDAKDDTPMMKDATLGYPMQLGSGNTGTFIGATYTGKTNYLSWGAQSIFNTYFGKNKNDYSIGKILNSNVWMGINIIPQMSVALGVQHQYTSEIAGEDTRLNKMMMPLNNTNNSGGQQVRTLIGVNWLFTDGTLQNLRLAIEYKLPAYQYVNGIQMTTKNIITGGIQYSF